MYSFLGKTNTVIESLEGCPTDKKNMVYKQQALIDNLFNDLTAIKAQIKYFQPAIKINTILGASCDARAKSAVQELQDEKEKLQKELDELDKEFDNT